MTETKMNDTVAKWFAKAHGLVSLASTPAADILAAYNDAHAPQPVETEVCYFVALAVGPKGAMVQKSEKVEAPKRRRTAGRPSQEWSAAHKEFQARWQDFQKSNPPARRCALVYASED